MIVSRKRNIIKFFYPQSRQTAVMRTLVSMKKQRPNKNFLKKENKYKPILITPKKNNNNESLIHIKVSLNSFIDLLFLTDHLRKWKLHQKIYFYKKKCNRDQIKTIFQKGYYRPRPGYSYVIQLKHCLTKDVIELLKQCLA